MRRILAAAVLVTAATAPQAQAAPILVGTSCAMVVAGPGDTFGTGSVRVSGLMVGAVAAADTDTTNPPLLGNPADVRMRCWIESPPGDPVPNSTATSVVNSWGAVVFEVVQDLEIPHIPARVCTEVTVDGVVRYTGCSGQVSTIVPGSELCDDLLSQVCPITGQVAVLGGLPEPIVVL